MDVLSAAGLIMRGAGETAFGAYKSSDFGRKGAALGALIGLGGFAAGQAVEGQDPTLTSAMAGGAISGVIGSAFSTYQELKAFEDPFHVAAMSSINTTTTATAKTNAWYNGTKQVGSSIVKGDVKGIGKGVGTFFAEGADPANWMTDITRMTMISGDADKLVSRVTDTFGGIAQQEKPNIKTAGRAVKGLGSSVWAAFTDNIAAADSAEKEGTWFSRKGGTVHVAQIGNNLKPILDANGDVVRKAVHISPTDHMGERMAKFVEANSGFYDMVFDSMNKIKEGDVIGGLARIGGGAQASQIESQIFDQIEEMQKTFSDPEELVKNRHKYVQQAEENLYKMSPDDPMREMMEQNVHHMRNMSDDELRAEAKNFNEISEKVNHAKSELTKNLDNPEELIKNRHAILNEQSAALDGLPDELSHVKDQAKEQIERFRGMSDDEIRAHSKQLGGLVGEIKDHSLRGIWNSLDNTEHGQALKGQLRANAAEKLMKSMVMAAEDDMPEELNSKMKKAVSGFLDGDDTYFKNHKEYAEYLRGMNGGALGTYEEMKRAGVYTKDGKKAPFLKQAFGLWYETSNGSPAWARTVHKQMENGTIQNVEHSVDANGNKTYRMIADHDGRVRIKGGGRGARVAALLMDTVVLGGLQGALYGGAMYAASRPFKTNQDANTWAN